ncbi:MAG: hypothetical protein WD066_05220 [Planctomycetaceae bacterium]
MWHDPIVEEVRRWREAYSARFHHDLKAICEDIRKREKEGGRKLVSRPPKLATSGMTHESRPVSQ